MSIPPAYSGPDEPCPRCYRIMIDLGKFRADENFSGTTLGEGGGGFGGAMRAFGAMESLILPLAWLGARGRQRRLEKILDEHPRSIICTGCGHLVKR